MRDIDAKLAEVIDRIGGNAVQIAAYPSDPPCDAYPMGVVEIRWRRLYNGFDSGERWITAPSLSAALDAVIAWEDRADAGPTCDVCGSKDLESIRGKVHCRACHALLETCCEGTPLVRERERRRHE